MKTFADSEGRKWNLSLTIAAAKRVRGLLGVNLLDLDQGDPPLLTRLGTDVMLLVDVVFCLVKPQADAEGISDEQFGAALGGEAVLAAQTAFYEELVDFFRQCGRGHLARAAEKQVEIMAAATEAGERRIDAVDAGAVVAELVGKQETLGNSSGNSPASADSTPCP